MHISCQEKFRLEYPVRKNLNFKIQLGKFSEIHHPYKHCLPSLTKPTEIQKDSRSTMQSLNVYHLQSVCTIRACTFSYSHPKLYHYVKYECISTEKKVSTVNLSVLNSLTNMTALAKKQVSHRELGINLFVFCLVLLILYIQQVLGAYQLRNRTSGSSILFKANW